MNKDPYSIIMRPVMTEKANFDVNLRNAYHFEVALHANKIDIAKAIEEIYRHKGVKVTKVRVMNKQTKKRRYRFRQSTTKTWKKAIVFLDKENRLELF